MTFDDLPNGALFTNVVPNGIGSIVFQKVNQDTAIVRDKPHIKFDRKRFEQVLTANKVTAFGELFVGNEFEYKGQFYRKISDFHAIPTTCSGLTLRFDANVIVKRFKTAFDKD